MDHLPYPSNAHYPQVTVPYLLDEAIPHYDRGDFSSFASRSGWQTNDGEWFECDARIAAERAQIWLYFGLLQHIFGSAILVSDFIGTKDGQLRVVSTSRKLPDLLKKWSGARRWRIVEFLLRTVLWVPAVICSGGLLLLFSRSAWVQRQVRPSSRFPSESMKALREVEAQIQKLEQCHSGSLDVSLTCLAVRALLWSIRNAAVNRDPNIFKKSRLELSSSPYLKAILLERGFCAHELEWMQKSCSVATLHYLSAYSYHQLGHENCSAAACVAYVLEAKDYVTRHVNEGCECQLRRVDLGKLTAIIDCGQIPVVCASVDANNVQLEVKATSPNIPYVAISHAWSGGLGNPRTSSLPCCQITRIVSQIQPLFQPRPNISSGTARWPSWLTRRSRLETTSSRDGDVSQCAFWMDTLCIPTIYEVSSRSETRIKALSPMNRIYAEAANVVVLDETLNANPRDARLQFASTVFTSSWMTRCWTYLEGRLAQNLLVALDTTLQDAFVLCHTIARHFTLFEYFLYIWNDTFQLEREMASSLYKLRSMKDDTVEYRRLNNFLETWNELLRRTTSRQADLLIILAIMLDLSVYEAELIESSELRLLAIMKTQDTLPISFLFEGGSPTYQVNGLCSWLPKSFETPVNITCGRLRKLSDPKTNEHYFKMIIPRGVAYVVRVRKRTRGSTTSKIRLHSSILPDLLLLIDTSGANEVDSGASAPEETSIDLIYIIPKPFKSGSTSGIEKGFGCVLQVIQDRRKSVLLAYRQAVSYTVVHEPDETSSTFSDQVNNIEETEAMGMEKELRLEGDWSKWPSLEYQRSSGAKPMTSKQGPVHPYVAVLCLFELAIGLTSSAMIVIVFPNAEIFAGDFWWTATPAEWFTWALCIVLLLLRAYVILKLELPALNKLLKLVEFERWTNSFDHKALDEAQADLRRPLSEPYQYHSWIFVGLVVLVSGALLVLGLTIDRPMLYDLAMLGGYLLLQVTIRMSAEVLWRLPRLRKYRIRLTKLIFEDYREGMPSVGIRKFLFEPNLLTHHTDKLSEVFEDPLYLPEHYMRGR